MTSEDTPQHHASGTVSQQLRAGRDRAGLTVTEVAESQHLRPSVVQAIENGDYRQVDSEIFLKGYVRAYAGLLGLDSDALMAQLDQELEPLRKEREEALEDNPLVNIERRKQRKKRVARVLLFLVMVAALVYAWFYYNGIELMPGNGVEEVVMEPEQSSAETMPAQGDTGNRERAPAANREPEGRAVLPAASGNPEDGAADSTDDTGQAPVGEYSGDGSSVDEHSVSADAADTSASQRPQSVTANAPLFRAPAVATEMPAAEPVDASLPDSEGRGPVGPSGQVLAGGGGGESAAPARVQLIASFSDSCWVQVDDGTGRTLLASLQGAGDRIQLEGIPPLRVVFGAANAVNTVRFEGDPVEMSSYRVVNNRVEFSLDI